MKRIFQHPEEKSTGRKYWRSLEEYADTPEFRTWLEREFPEGASEMEVDGVSRRNFLRLMGASMALAGVGVAGCRRPEAYITPYTKSVEWQIPGKALLYATAMPTRSGAVPLVATTYDGRPTKLEGNSLHPASNGGTDAFAQASVLELWDPDRSRYYLNNGEQTDYRAFVAYLKEIATAQAGNGGAGLAVLLEEEKSPSVARMMEELRRVYPQVKIAVYESLGNEPEARVQSAALGTGSRLSLQFEKAEVVVSLASDFLGGEESNVQYLRDFSRRRRMSSTEDTPIRLYVAESRYTPTGGMADHRLRIRNREIPGLTVALARKVAELTGDSSIATLANGVETAGSVDQAWVDGLAADLVAHRGKSVLTVGRRQPEVVHALALAINNALGNIGQTVFALDEGIHVPTLSLKELVDEINNGQVKSLIIVGGNPVYNAPADFNFGEILGKVENTVRVGYWEDETSEKSGWHVPKAHYLESWGDGVGTDGTYTAVQPMILPIYDGLTTVDVLALLAGKDKPEGPEIVRETFDGRVAGADDDKWNLFLKNGFVEGTAPALRAFQPDFSAVKVVVDGSVPLASATADKFELVFAADYKVDDGRFVNNGWMQEVPDPITKITWDNALLISPASAKELGVKNGDLLQVTLDGRTLNVPALIAPGHADGSLTLSLGYGRTRTGHIGRGTGFNASVIRTSTTMLAAATVDVAVEGGTYELAVAHGHWTMEGRGLFRENTLENYRKDPTFASNVGMDSHIPPDFSLYKTAPLTAPEQWAMSIDLNTCTGCLACIIACQAENNIPIVGKEQVIHQREMHWMRIDRYFATVDEEDPNPEMVMQPVACMQCENAPCETVCPVNATVHSDDGLNVMVYNRCIGTRYCANNCPYKVRRFNFFDYNQRQLDKLYLGPLGPKGTEESIKLSKNPNVTVRMRGVMEKCTFCVQRIEEARIEARVAAGASDNVKIPTDRIKTACQQVCSAEAIVFGDKNDPESAVTRLRESDRNYVTLKYLNVRPRISYLARIRNPNQNIPGAEKVGMINGAGHDDHGDAHDDHGENTSH